MVIKRGRANLSNYRLTINNMKNAISRVVLITCLSNKIFEIIKHYTYRMLTMCHTLFKGGNFFD